jgi:hypothetical protein
MLLVVGVGLVLVLLLDIVTSFIKALLGWLIGLLYSFLKRSKNSHPVCRSVILAVIGIVYLLTIYSREPRSRTTARISVGMV